jgi:U32 family peptidase
MIRNKPELLAPAGNLSCAISAYKSGADAVYCGLSRFNAREGADNFSFDDLSRLAAYAKKFGKRYYITLNTLLKEDEIDEALEEVQKIAHLEPDAIIVQDLGLVAAIGEIFPSISLHASTQMGIHNSAGLALASELGIDRVILERQIDIEELRRMAASSPVELEVFIHGALCCSLSGMCLFSSWMGGWSGNRGRCKQPCRRRFHSTGKEKQSGFFFSTQDLYSVELIQEYIRLGITSLKIEGRLKKEEYIEHVVRAYRMILDEIEIDEMEIETSPELKGRAKQELSKSYGRRWSQGFVTARDRASLIIPSSPGISGLLVGDVLSLQGRKINVRLSRPIKKGDRLRIQDTSGGEASAFRLLTMKKGNKVTGMAFPGELVTIFPEDHLSSAADGREKQLKLFKVGESSKTAIRDSSSLPLFQSSMAIDIRVEIDETGLRVTSLGQSFVWQPRMEKAEKRVLDQEMVEELFSSTRNSLYKLGRCETLIDGAWFIPPGELKQIRREFWIKIEELLSSQSDEEEKRDEAFPSIQSHCAPKREKSERVITERPLRGSDLKPLEEAEKGEEALLPIFVPETGLEAFQLELQRAITRGVHRFRITSLFQFPLLRPHLQALQGTEEEDEEDEPFELTCSWPLPVSNSCTVQLLEELGAQIVQGWIELDRSALDELIKASSLPVERFIRGRVPLLVSRATIAASGVIVDGRGRRFTLTSPVKKPYHPEGITILWSDGEFIDPEYNSSDTRSYYFAGKLLPGYDYPKDKPGEDENQFNLDREWK